MGPSVPGRIPWTTLDAYATRHDLSRSELGLMDICASAMDADYLAWWMARNVKDPPP